LNKKFSEQVIAKGHKFYSLDTTPSSFLIIKGPNGGCVEVNFQENSQNFKDIILKELGLAIKESSQDIMNELIR